MLDLLLLKIDVDGRIDPETGCADSTVIRATPPRRAAVKTGAREPPAPALAVTVDAAQRHDCRGLEPTRAGGPGRPPHTAGGADRRQGLQLPLRSLPRQASEHPGVDPTTS